MLELQKLDYNYDALEPYISSTTLSIHHDKHHKNYLDKLNKILVDLNYNFQESLETLVTNIEQFPIDKRDDILFNAGGVLNHNLYFSNISPNKNTTPTGELKQKIIDTYGSTDKFIEEFKRNANLVQGSGYTFLVLTPSNTLEIINVSNQETPYLYGLTPIMTIDLWEHAYYLDYQNRRSEYIDNFFAIIDFEKVNENYKKAKTKNTKSIL